MKGEKICVKCKKRFMPTQWNQLYCGSKTKKTGCSYEMHLKRIQDYVKKNYKEYMREYQKDWHKKQRLLGTPYAQRQLKHKRDYSKTNNAKLKTKLWRKNNIEKILEWNRRRVLKKKGIIGEHTKMEWLNLKKRYNYRCAICNISENELKIKWQGTQFDKLTRDHKCPLSRGGTDYIDNIQPLCISCNAKKKDGEEVMKCQTTS